MALLFMDGFDHYNGDPSNSGKWSSSGGGSCSISFSVSRTGLGSLKGGFDGAEAWTRILAPTGGAVVGCAYNTNGFTTRELISIYEGSSINHVYVEITSVGKLNVKRGDGTVLASGTTTLLINAWYYIEFKTVISDTVGTYEVRIDGIVEMVGSAADTKNGGTGAWDRVRLKMNSSAAYFDDIYVCDTNGAAPRNNFLGSVKIETLLPQTDAVSAGSNAGLTPSTGTDHGAMVDENPPNTSDFNSASTVGLKDTYQYPTMTLTGTIYGVQTNLYVNKSDAVARQVCAVVRPVSTDFDGANISPTTVFTYFSEIRAQNPQTSADWLVSDITALQVGMKVTV